MGARIEYKEGDKIGLCSFIKEVSPKVINRNETNNRVRKRRKVLVKCICGNEFTVLLDKLRFGKTKSCGCLYNNNLKQFSKTYTVHGKRNHPLYHVWKDMLERCNSIKFKQYKDYGGRGITVCERWKEVTNFINDMYPTFKEGLQMDRIDNNGNYEPSNCKWSTRKENMNNTRRSKNNYEKVSTSIRVA